MPKRIDIDYPKGIDPGIPKSADDVLSGESRELRYQIFISDQLRIMDEKIDKLHSFLDALINHKQAQLLGPIQRMIIEQIGGRILIPEETALVMRAVGSALKDVQEQQTRKNKCQTKKNTKCANQKKTCTGSITARKNNWNVLSKLKSFWDKF
jgi:hypothetical protein